MTKMRIAFGLRFWRHIVDGANVREDPESVRPILESVRLGQMPEPPILLADESLERLVILEGHNRMIAYATEPKEVPFPIRAIVGVSARISEWSEW